MTHVNTWIVIPTYWGDSADGIYDHPTPLDGESTLPRLLESLNKQQAGEPFQILILVSTSREEVEAVAMQKVLQLLEPFKDQLEILVIDAQISRQYQAFFEGRGLDLKLGNMQSYAAVRNMQLLYPAAHGAEVIIALDDDETVAPDYLDRALQYISEKCPGICGPYLDEQGSPYIREPEQIRNLLLDKAGMMNRTMRGLISSAELTPITPMSFGGNMVFHHALFTRVGFDPGITRGEDIDYLINTRIAGIKFRFDPTLTITHLPPRHYESAEYAKLKQDVFRFGYEREKLVSFGIPAESLAPYPGELLGEDLLEQAAHALELLGTPKMQERYGSPAQILEETQRKAQIALQQYQVFLKDWPQAMQIADDIRMD